MSKKFKAFNKKTANSFHKQRNMIKKALQGQTQYCDVCGQALRVSIDSDANTLSFNCAKGCTVLVLDGKSVPK